MHFVTAFPWATHACSCMLPAMQANAARLMWNSTGTAVLALTAADVDATNQVPALHPYLPLTACIPDCLQGIWPGSQGRPMAAAAAARLASRQLTGWHRIS